MKDNKLQKEAHPNWQKQKANEALAKAKALEAQQIAKGKKTVRLDRKTIVLR